MAPSDEASLRKVLWTLYWRGDARLRERIEDELRPPNQPKVPPEKEVPVPDAVLNEVAAFVKLARDGAYMAGDRRVHHTERSKWRLTFRRLAIEALTALQADNPGPAQQAVAEIVDLACETKVFDYFHSDDPVEAAKFVVSDAVAVLWESVLRHDGFTAFVQRVPAQLIRCEADYGWTRRGYGQVAEKETALSVPLARLLTTPDMWRRFTEAYLAALDAAGRTPAKQSRIMYASFDFDESRYQRQERAKDLAAWHELLLDHFGAGPEDGLLDQLIASPGLAGPELTFLRARIAERRGERTQAAALVTQCLKELPGHTAYLSFRRRQRQWVCVGSECVIAGPSVGSGVFLRPGRTGGRRRWRAGLRSGRPTRPAVRRQAGTGPDGRRRGGGPDGRRGARRRALRWRRRVRSGTPAPLQARMPGRLPDHPTSQPGR
jgi:hypothetical protein